MAHDRLSALSFQVGGHGVWKLLIKDSLDTAFNWNTSSDRRRIHTLVNITLLSAESVDTSVRRFLLLVVLYHVEFLLFVRLHDVKIVI